MTTHKERIQATLNHEKTDRPPIALWRHFPVDDQSPETLAAATLHFQNTYDWDIVKVTPASSFCVRDWGVEDKWNGHTEGTREYTKRAIQNPMDWEKLKALDPMAAPHLSSQLACLRLLKKTLSPDVPLIQTVFSPLAQAKNLAGNEMLISHIRQHPEAVMKGLETIAKTTKKFIESLADIGIDGIFYAVQHAQANLLTLDEYKSFGLPNDQTTLQATEPFWCNMIHLHGKDVYFSLLRLMNFPIVNWHDRETYPSLSEAHSLFKGVSCGGLRQDSLVYEDQDKVKEEAADAISQVKNQRLILGTGCVVPVIASHGNLIAARKSVEAGLTK